MTTLGDRARARRAAAVPIGKRSGPLPTPAAEASRVGLSVDPIACDGHGLCAELLPEMLTPDDWGYPVVVGSRVPARLVTAARRAAAACPKLALVVSNLADPDGVSR